MTTICCGSTETFIPRTALARALSPTSVENVHRQNKSAQNTRSTKNCPIIIEHAFLFLKKKRAHLVVLRTDTLPNPCEKDPKKNLSAVTSIFWDYDGQQLPERLTRTVMVVLELALGRHVTKLD